jgi:hypothetical protein
MICTRIGRDPLFTAKTPRSRREEKPGRLPGSFKPVDLAFLRVHRPADRGRHQAPRQPFSLSSESTRSPDLGVLGALSGEFSLVLVGPNLCCLRRSGYLRSSTKSADETPFICRPVLCPRLVAAATRRTRTFIESSGSRWSVIRANRSFPPAPSAFHCR